MKYTDKMLKLIEDLKNEMNVNLESEESLEFQIEYTIGKDSKLTLIRLEVTAEDQ